MSGPVGVADYGDTRCLYRDDKGRCSAAGELHMLLDLPTDDRPELRSTVACRHHSAVIQHLSPVYGIHWVEEICHLPESKWKQETALESACVLPPDELEQEAARMALVDEVRQHQDA